MRVQNDIRRPQGKGGDRMGHTDYVLMDVLPVVVLYKNIAGNYEWISKNQNIGIWRNRT